MPPDGPSTPSSAPVLRAYSSRQRYALATDELRDLARRTAPAKHPAQPASNTTTPAPPAPDTAPGEVRDWAAALKPDEKRRAGRSFPTLARAMWAVLRGSRSTIFFALATNSVATLLGLITPLIWKFVFDYVLLDSPGPRGLQPLLGYVPTPLSLLIASSAALILLTVLAAAIGTWGRYHLTRLAKVTASRMRRLVFGHLAQLPLHRVAAVKSGGAASLLRDDAGAIAEMLFSVLYNPWRAALTLVGGLAALAYLDYRLLLGGLMLLPMTYFSHRTWINRIRPVQRKVRVERTAADAHAAESFAGIRVLRAFGRRRGESARFIRNNHTMARLEMLAWWRSRWLEIVWMVFVPFCTAFAVIYGGTAVLDRSLTLGELSAFVSYLFMLFGPLEVLVSSAAQLQTSLAGFDRCLDLLAEPTEFQQPDPTSPTLAAAAAIAPVPPSALANGSAALHPPPTPTPLSITPERLRASSRGHLSIQHLSFAYPRSASPVLHDISLDVRPGETIALVGVSGSGKTTLCNLIARFFDPSQGRILLDGHDLRSIPVDAYRSLLGVVEQDVFLFDGSVADNIAFSRAARARRHLPDYHASLRSAALQAGALPFILALEHGFDTIIGERGVRLSGGQRQRLAIARAILADPRILILDEATSNLDSESELLIQRSLAHLMLGRTSFVIAHRLSTIRHASRIVVLEHGRIVELGPHDDLLARGGRYAQMLALQLNAPADLSAPHAPSP